MNKTLILLSIAALIAAGVGCEKTKAGRQSDTTAAPNVQPAQTTGLASKSKSDAEPLLLADEPLLLADASTNKKPAAGPVADNSRCHVCHVNLAEEELAVNHAHANIGCAQCHGASDAHIADESWASGGNGTAPDIMYPRSTINAACMKCHTREKIDTEPHKDLLAGTGDKSACTDCHGKHRLVNRKCKWK